MNIISAKTYENGVWLEDFEDQVRALCVPVAAAVAHAREQTSQRRRRATSAINESCRERSTIPPPTESSHQ